MVAVLSDLPPTLGSTRAGLHRVAAHVLARRRHDAAGRIGLRPAPGGVGTPAIGDDAEVVRTSGRFLVAERAGAVNLVTRAPLTTLAAAAELAGVDLGADFFAGEGTPPVGDPDAPLAVDDAAARLLGRWYAFGQEAIDELVATVPAVTAADTPQVWPEHFDLGCTVRVAAGPARGPDAGVRLNLGASPGDGQLPAPYLYVGPWGDDRPGAAGYWNVPFGAALTYDEVAALTPADRRARAVAFLRAGVTRSAGAAG
jgi:hypothetical protein